MVLSSADALGEKNGVGLCVKLHQLLHSLYSGNTSSNVDTLSLVADVKRLLPACECRGYMLLDANIVLSRIYSVLGPGYKPEFDGTLSAAMQLAQQQKPSKATAYLYCVKALHDLHPLDSITGRIRPPSETDIESALRFLSLSRDCHKMCKQECRKDENDCEICLPTHMAFIYLRACISGKYMPHPDTCIPRDRLSQAHFCLMQTEDSMSRLTLRRQVHHLLTWADFYVQQAKTIVLPDMRKQTIDMAKEKLSSALTLSESCMPSANREKTFARRRLDYIEAYFE